MAIANFVYVILKRCDRKFLIKYRILERFVRRVIKDIYIYIISRDLITRRFIFIYRYFQSFITIPCESRSTY